MSHKIVLVDMTNTNHVIGFIADSGTAYIYGPVSGFWVRHDVITSAGGLGINLQLGIGALIRVLESKSSTNCNDSSLAVEDDFSHY